MVCGNLKFDLNKHPDESCFDDTALRLECFGPGSVRGVREQDTKSATDGCGLVVGLGPASSLNERDLVLKLGISQCSTNLKSDVSSVSSLSVEFGVDHVVDEGSTSGKSSGGYMPSLILAPRVSVPLQKLRISEAEVSGGSGFLTEIASDQKTSDKKCEILGWANGQAEYGIAEGYGVRCSHPKGCRKAARGKSGLCVNHGGGKRFVVEGCARSAGLGRGRQCCFDGCVKGAQGSSMLCKVHGGGKLCKAPSGGKRSLYDGGGFCTKSVHQKTDVFIAHDGGKSRVIPRLKTCRSVVQDTKENNGFLGITPRLFHGLISGPGPISPDNHSLSCSSTVSSSTSWLAKLAKRRQMIPPQVLVPSSMKSSGNNCGRKSLDLVTTEDGSLSSFGDRNLIETVTDEI